MHVYGCSAHFANLLAKDICSSDGKLAISKILTIVKYLRNTHAAVSKLDAKQMTKPPIPVETRWNTQQAMVQYFIDNWMNIACIVSELLPKSNKIYRYMEDIQLKRAGMDLLEVLTPIKEALDTLQRDDTTLSDATEVWKQLLETCPGLYKENVVKRMNEAALEYIRTCDNEIVPDVMKFLAKQCPYNMNLFENYQSASATAWWILGQRLGFPEKVKFAVSLESAVCSSGGLERQFSTMGYTYGTLRTQLGVERAGKLSFLYRQLNK